jgi:hypothetical protein
MSTVLARPLRPLVALFALVVAFTLALAVSPGGNAFASSQCDSNYGCANSLQFLPNNTWPVAQGTQSNTNNQMLYMVNPFSNISGGVGYSLPIGGQYVDSVSVNISKGYSLHMRVNGYEDFFVILHSSITNTDYTVGHWLGIGYDFTIKNYHYFGLFFQTDGNLVAYLYNGSVGGQMNVNSQLPVWATSSSNQFQFHCATYFEFSDNGTSNPAWLTMLKRGSSVAAGGGCGWQNHFD